MTIPRNLPYDISIINKYYNRKIPVSTEEDSNGVRNKKLAERFFGRINNILNGNTERLKCSFLELLRIAKWEIRNGNEDGLLYSELILNCAFHENKDISDYASKACTHLYMENKELISKAAFHALRIFDRDVNLKGRPPERCKFPALQNILKIALSAVSDPKLGRELEASMTATEFEAVRKRLIAFEKSYKDHPKLLKVKAISLDAKPLPKEEEHREKIVMLRECVEYKPNLKKWEYDRVFRNRVSYCGTSQVMTGDNSFNDYQFTAVLRDYIEFRRGNLKERPTSVIAIDLYMHERMQESQENYHVFICNEEAIVIDPFPKNMEKESDVEPFLFAIYGMLKDQGIGTVRLCQYDSLETKNRTGSLKLYDVLDNHRLSLHSEIPGLPCEKPRPESVKRGNNYLGMALCNFLKDKYPNEILHPPQGCEENRGATNLLKEFVQYWNSLDIEEARKQYQRVVDKMNKVDTTIYRYSDWKHGWYVP